MFCSRCGHGLVDGARFCPSCGLDQTSVTPVGAATAKSVADKSETDLVREALSSEYELLEELGRGGMAIVHRARERQLEREVAVKVLPFSLAFDAEFVERFQREARTAARLEHPNIIPIYRVGQTGRVIYFVMKLLRGQSLSRILSARGALAPVEIRHLLSQTGGALGFAHRHGIVHRDIKPDNIMFDEHGHPVLTDFGIAKAASGTRLTGTGMSIGTPHYMSPEQARAQPLDGRSDLYSLGVVAYQCLTGHVPFDGEDAFSIGYKHIMEALPEPPLETAEARRLYTVIRQMLEKKPEDRYQTAEELVRSLEGGRPSVTLLEMDPGGSTLALTPEQAARVASTHRQSLQVAEKTTPREPAVPVPAAPGPSAPPPSRAAAAPATAPPPPAITTPSTPETPLPRRPALRPPRPAPKKRSGGGVLVAAAVLLAIGVGGAGGYFVYTRILQVPPPVPVAPIEVDLATVSVPPVNAALVALRDSLVRAEAERVRGLPDSGWLVVRGIPDGARLFVGDQAYRDTVVWLGVGTQKIRVAATGYLDFDGSVAVPKADTVTYLVTMKRDTAGRPAPVTRPTPPPSGPVGQCTNPGQRTTYNLGSVCWDEAPRLQGAAYVTVPPGSIESTRPVLVLVHVGADGRALTAAPAPRNGDDLSFMRLAVRYARAQTYVPATKNGRAVESWFPFRFAPQVRQ
ncbi:MAG: serine/threonine-protein kinase [Gemmatimonadota bacterium]|nr:serine/threonine-protein kinase [Gemmatimonadota bacterium]